MKARQIFYSLLAAGIISTVFLGKCAPLRAQVGGATLTDSSGAVIHIQNSGAIDATSTTSRQLQFGLKVYW